MAASTQQGTRSMLHLYRQILKNAKVFPSRGREGMIKEIREEFRINAKETDLDKIKQQRELAMKGLSQLQTYTGLSYDDANWSVNLEQAPLGAMSDEHYEEKMKSRGAEAIVIEAKKVDPE